VIYNDPNYISADFISVSLGYLSLHERRLPDLLRILPAPASTREKAIAAAIRWGVDNPNMWSTMRQSYRFERRPEEAVVRSWM
jgi:hypothetical protein